jgi:hypothetical protein
LKVVKPQPLSTGALKDVIMNIGSLKMMMSPAFSGVFNENVNVIAVAAPATGFPSSNTVCSSAGVGATTGLDPMMPVAAMLAESAKVTATVLVERFACCAVLEVVTPLSIVTVHRTPAFICAVAAVNVTEAVPDPDPATATVKVVVPQPLVVKSARTFGEVPNVKSGITRAMVSATFSGALSSNEYETDVADHVEGRESAR